MLEAELFAFLESTADAAFSITETGEILSWNAAAEALFGFKPSEVLHKQCHEVLDARGRLGTSICMRDCAVQRCALHAGPAPSFDIQARHRHGGTVWANVSTLTYRNPRNGRLIIVHLARDITARMKREALISEWIDISRRLALSENGSVGTAPAQALSDREIQILRLLAQAKSPAEVSRAVGISPSTLRNHLHRINEKLGTRDRLSAVLNAMHRGLI
jgi:PAS domain S-box-containing protein